MSASADLHGSTRLCHPRGLPDLIRSVGWLVRVFAFIARSTTKRELRLSLVFLANVLQDNPINHKEMDRITGFRIVNHILKHRVQLVDRHVINILFGFCGFSDGCTSGELVNQAAFQAFFMDWGLWHACEVRCKVYVFQCLCACLTVNVNRSKNLVAMRSLEVVPWVCAFLGNVKLLDDLMVVGCHLCMLLSEFLNNNSTKEELKVIADWIVSPLSSVCYVVPHSLPSRKIAVGQRRTVNIDPIDEESSEDEEENTAESRTTCTRVLFLEMICIVLQRQPEVLRAYVSDVLTLDWTLGILFRAKHLWSQEMEAQEAVAAVCVLRMLPSLLVCGMEFRKDFLQSGHLLLAQLLSDTKVCNDLETYRILFSALLGMNVSETKTDSLSAWFEQNRHFSVKTPELIGVIFAVMASRFVSQFSLQKIAERDDLIEDVINVLVLLCDQPEFRESVLTSRNLLGLMDMVFWRSKMQYDQGANDHSVVTPNIDIFNLASSTEQQQREEKKPKECSSSFTSPSTAAVFRFITKIVLEGLCSPSPHATNVLDEILDRIPFYATIQDRTEFQTAVLRELGLSILADSQFISNLVSQPSLLHNFQQACHRWLLLSNLSFGDGILKLLEVLVALMTAPSQDSSGSLLRWGNSTRHLKEELMKTLQFALLLAYANAHGGPAAVEHNWGPRTQTDTWKHDLIWLHSFVARNSKEVLDKTTNVEFIGCFLFHLFYDFMDEWSNHDENGDNEMSLIREGAFGILQEVWKPELISRLALAKKNMDEQTRALFDKAVEEGDSALQDPTWNAFRVWAETATTFTGMLTAEWRTYWIRLEEQTRSIVTNSQRVARIRQEKNELQEQSKMLATGKQRLLRQMHGIHNETLLSLRAWVQNSENWQRSAEVLWWRMVECLKALDQNIVQSEQKSLEKKSLVGVDESKDDAGGGFEPLPLEIWKEREHSWDLEESHFWEPGGRVGISLNSEEFESNEKTSNGTEGQNAPSQSSSRRASIESSTLDAPVLTGDVSQDTEIKSSLHDQIETKDNSGASPEFQAAESVDLDALAPPPPAPPPDAPPLMFEMPTPAEQAGPKLKRFHWDKMQGVDISKTVWGSIREIPIELDMERFEETFTTKSPIKKPEEQKPTSVVVKFVDARRSQVVEIGLARFNMSITEIHEAILSMDPRLDASKLKHLLNLLPSSQEIDQVNSYKGNLALLGGAEKFFKEMAQIPHVAARVRALSFSSTFHGSYEDILLRLAVVESCREKIEKSVSLRQLLAVVLQLGNRMNQSTNKGQAMGFRLSSLSRLRQTKAADNKTSLLHYVVEHVRAKPEGCLFLKELEGLGEGARIETAQIQLEVNILSEGLEDFKASMDLVRDSDGPNAMFFKHCTGVYRSATKELGVLATQLSSCVTKCNDLGLFFGEASLSGWEELFGVFRDFCTAFKEAERDLDKQKEAEEAARKRQQLAETLQKIKKAPGE